MKALGRNEPGLTVDYSLCDCCYRLPEAKKVHFEPARTYQFLLVMSLNKLVCHGAAADMRELVVTKRNDMVFIWVKDGKLDFHDFSLAA
jgi:hypothetical protein